jgi:hypothetical protein
MLSEFILKQFLFKSIVAWLDMKIQNGGGHFY